MRRRTFFTALGAGALGMAIPNAALAAESAEVENIKMFLNLLKRTSPKLTGIFSTEDQVEALRWSLGVINLTPPFSVFTFSDTFFVSVMKAPIHNMTRCWLKTRLAQFNNYPSFGDVHTEMEGHMNWAMDMVEERLWAKTDPRSQGYLEHFLK